MRKNMTNTKVAGEAVCRDEHGRTLWHTGRICKDKKRLCQGHSMIVDSDIYM